jgi:glycerol-3-phosphate acyltransferase PlsY
MNFGPSNILLLILSYLLGSVPSSVWIGKIFYNTDVRDHGSGNAGTTNTFRVLGIIPGIIVFVIDVLKGWIAVYLANFDKGITPGSDWYYLFSIILGLVTITGHLFPVFAGFRGGKGVATALGIGFGLHPLPAALVFLFFVLTFLIFRFVSVSSILAGLFYPFLMILVLQVRSLPLIIFSLLIPVIIFVTHTKNIKRLIKGEEPKFYFKRRISKDKPYSGNMENS